VSVKNPALGDDGVDYSNESYKHRVARWRRDVLYAKPPVDHLDPIPQFPAQHTPPPFAKRPKAKPKAAPPKPLPTTPADLFAP
jgi:hypothetical protein